MQALTLSQIERLGERLRKGVTPEDLALLRTLRESYRPVLDVVVAEVRGVAEALGVEAALATRPAKTTRSIIAKLQRERTNLARMQDIAGCRIVVPDRAQQNAIVEELQRRQPLWKTDDLRDRPHHGYRAVHLVTPRPLPVEVQVRTLLEQVWASLSEALDRRSEGVKYGRGPQLVLDYLARGSERLAAWDAAGGPDAALLRDKEALVTRLTAILTEP